MAVIVVAMILLAIGLVWHRELEIRRKENMIKRHRTVTRPECHFSIFTLDPEQEVPKKKKLERYPKEFRYFQVITNNCRMEFCKLEDIQKMLETQTFNKLKYPVIKDNVLLSELFIAVNGIILPRNFVTGCFVPRSHDCINLVTFWGDVFRIKISEKFGEDASTFTYSGYLVKSMLNKAIDDYRNGSVDYKALITGE